MPHDPAPAACGPPRRPPGAAGFSLIEVLTVLVMIGIMVMLAAPRLNLSPSRTEAAVNGVAGTLMAAQRAAVSGQHDVVVAFDEAQRRIRVHHDLNNDGAIGGGEPIKWKPLENGVIFGRGSAAALAQLGARAVSFTGTQGALPAVTFSRGGSASEEGGVYLTTPPAASPPAGAA
ncbi:MAG TPA: prepilin-type N-terminal cleavage/methylation domain-containing protein, partial [Longimicrobium sp.]|nr:prepilin-type N-terminal cleavage/methylation domain-containing protein [Longimicrobium sp.]